jgi:hypothetical protein
MAKTTAELLQEYQTILAEAFPEDYRSHHAAWSEGYRSALSDFKLGRKSEYSSNGIDEYSEGYNAGWSNAVRLSNETPARPGQTYYDQDKTDKIFSEGEMLREYSKIIAEAQGDPLIEGQMEVKSKEFDFEEQAAEASDRYYRHFHPAGYGTRLKVKQNENGKWIFVGTRWDSCD